MKPKKKTYHRLSGFSGKDTMVSCHMKNPRNYTDKFDKITCKKCLKIYKKNEEMYQKWKPKRKQSWKMWTIEHTGKADYHLAMRLYHTRKEALFCIKQFNSVKLALGNDENIILKTKRVTVTEGWE